tara:strand:- start:316 stop:555 length:240 start_codon:yes stop_codon:yes gene_type:complete
MWELVAASYTIIFISQLCTNLSALHLAMNARSKNRSKDAKRINELAIAQRRRRAILSPAWPVVMLFDTFTILRHLLSSK